MKNVSKASPQSSKKRPSHDLQLVDYRQFKVQYSDIPDTQVCTYSVSKKHADFMQIIYIRDGLLIKECSLLIVL